MNSLVPLLPIYMTIFCVKLWNCMYYYVVKFCVLYAKWVCRCLHFGAQLIWDVLQARISYQKWNEIAIITSMSMGERNCSHLFTYLSIQSRKQDSMPKSRLSQFQMLQCSDLYVLLVILFVVAGIAVQFSCCLFTGSQLQWNVLSVV